MDLKQIQAFIKDFEKSSLNLLELEYDSVKIKLYKQINGEVVVAQAPVIVQDNLSTGSPSNQLSLPNTNQETLIPIKSPLVGTFYASSAPNNPPFVQSGQKIKKGQVVCIVEAMKIMNEITSPFDGVINKVEVKNGDAIGFDQVLMFVTP